MLQRMAVMVNMCVLGRSRHKRLEPRQRKDVRTLRRTERGFVEDTKQTKAKAFEKCNLGDFLSLVTKSQQCSLVGD